MRPLTLRNGLVLIVVAALLPISILIGIQGLSTLRYSRALVENKLITSALARAGSRRDLLIISKELLLTLSKNDVVRAGGTGCREALMIGFGYNPAILNLARSDAAGRVQCSVLPLEQPVSFARETWWQRGIKSRTFTLSPLVIGQISKKRTIIGMQPVVADNGSNDGAVTVAVDATWLERSLAGSKLAPDAVIAIIDGAGRVVLANDPEPLPRFDIQAGNAKAAEAIAPDGAAWMYAVAPLYEGQLYIVYAEPRSLAMASAVSQIRISLILAALAMLLAALAIWIGTNRLVLRWLESLSALAAQFAQGKFTGNLASYNTAPREIALLSTNLHTMANAIKARDDDLQVALTAKTALTHDIHHRVKNNLQIVSSLLSLQAAAITDPGAREALSQTRARIGALAQIHRLLYEESHDSDHGNVNIASLLTALCVLMRSLHRDQSHIHLSCNAAWQTVPINNAVPLTLFAVEAITNGYRHAFAAGTSGTICLHFDRTDDQATLMITDDGTGFDVDQPTTSTGQQLMTAFAQQLDGDLAITSARTGTVVRLTYPLEVIR